MANSVLDVSVLGLPELIENLRSLTKRDGDFVFYLKNAATRGAKLIGDRAAGNAAGLGLGEKGERDRENPDGRYMRYGRIPNSIFISKAAYARTNAVLVSVYVRRRAGIRPDAAPHANLIEGGFTAGGRAKHPKVAGRPFMKPALESEANAAINRIADVLKENIERLTFPNPPHP